MLSSLRITNFRLFENLTLENCGRANLIVGRNNSGKTCLLEALRIYGSPGDFGLLEQLVRARFEDLDALAPLDLDFSTSIEKMVHRSPLRNLFYGYQFAFGEDRAMEIGPVDGSGGTVFISPVVYSFQEDEEGNRVRRRKADQSIDKMADEDVLYIETGLRGRAGESERTSRMELSRLFNQRMYRSPAELAEVGVRFVAARPGDYDDGPLSEDWGRVAIRPKRRAYVLKALQLIDPDIREVVMVPGERRHRGRDQFVLVYDENKRLSLASLGDGIQRLFEIAVAAASSKGIILFDEFENGLHWSVQPLAWKLLLELSKDLGVQIFATTHSWDCVKAFQEVAGDDDETGILFHLGKSVRKSDYGQVLVTTYSGAELRAATRAGLEVR